MVPSTIFQTSISSFLDVGRRIGVNPVITDQARLEPMEALIKSSSLADADQVVGSAVGEMTEFLTYPGGGLVKSICSAST